MGLSCGLGVNWVMPRRILDLLLCWLVFLLKRTGCLYGMQFHLAWGGLFGERNFRIFEDRFFGFLAQIAISEQPVHLEQGFFSLKRLWFWFGVLRYHVSLLICCLFPPSVQIFTYWSKNKFIIVDLSADLFQLLFGIYRIDGSWEKGFWFGACK